MTDDLIERTEEALEDYEKNKKEWRHGFAKELFATPALTLLPEAIKEIKRLRGLLADIQSSQTYTYYGRDGKSVLARDLEDRAEAAEAEVARLRLLVPRPDQTEDELVWRDHMRGVPLAALAKEFGCTKERMRYRLKRIAENKLHLTGGNDGN